MSDLVQCSLTTVPPEVAASTTAAASVVEIDLNITLLQQPSRITVSLTIGTGETDLVPDQATAKSIDPQVGADDNAWTAATAVDSNQYTVTLTPTPGKAAVGHLRLTLAKTRLNNTTGAASIKVTAFQGETHQEVPCTVMKEKPGFYFDHLMPTLGQVAYGGPARLTWQARDIDTSHGFTLTWDNQTQTVGADARSVVVPGLTKTTVFTLTAVDKNTGKSHARETTVEMSLSDGTFTDLTVTGKLTLPPVSTTPKHQYVLDPAQPLVFTAPADGYYTIGFATHYRVLRLMPVLVDAGVTGPHHVQLALANGTTTHTFVRRTTGSAKATTSAGQTAAAAGKPVTVFVPAGARLTLTAQDTKVPQLWRSVALVLDVTWHGGNSDQALPPQKFDSALAAALPPAQFPTIQLNEQNNCYAVLTGPDEITEVDEKAATAHPVKGVRYFFYGKYSSDRDANHKITNERYGLFVGGAEGAWNLSAGYPEQAKRAPFLYHYSTLDDANNPNGGKRESWTAAMGDRELIIKSFMELPVDPFNQRTSYAEAAGFSSTPWPEDYGNGQQAVICWRDLDSCWTATTTDRVPMGQARQIQFFHILGSMDVAMGEVDGSVTFSPEQKYGWDWKKLGQGVVVRFFSAAKGETCYITPSAVHDSLGRVVQWPVTPLNNGLGWILDGDGAKGNGTSPLLSRKVVQ